AFEIFTIHAEDCADCSRAVGGLRDGALAVVGPIELVALSGATGGGLFDDLLDGLAVRVGMLVHRSAELATGLPGGARTAAVAAVGAAAIAGSTALPGKPPETEAAVATPAPTVVHHRVRTPVPTAVATPAPGRRAAPVRRVRSRPKAPPAPTAPPTVVATITSFESPETPAPKASSQPAGNGEFGFEH
ncbi:MAG: hypothetical protein QOE86_4686, partial [Solirubrobacteraceae bacterium]|nr:hypothetical protein [Solirubrobacteraceae bacterium]